MSKKSYDFEIKVSQGLSLYCPKFIVTHTGNNTSLSDISIEYNGYKTFVEAKLNGAQFGSPRIKYEDGKWQGVTNNPITNTVTHILSENPHSYSFITFAKSLYKDCYYQNIIPSQAIFRDEPFGYFTYNSLRNIINIIGNQYIYKENIDKSLLNTIIEYYKYKNVDYIQIGDNLYQINDNRLSKIPTIDASVELTVRLVNRKSKKWFEIIPTLKLKDLVESEYSILLNTKKKNPFAHI